MTARTTSQMWRSIGMPRKRARRSFSRMAIMVRPNGERRMNAMQADACREAQQHEVSRTAIVVVQRCRSEKAEIERLAREAAQPVIAAGQVAPLVGDVVAHLAEGDRHHREIDAAAAHHQRAEQRAGDAAQQVPAAWRAACSTQRISAPDPRRRRRGRNMRRGRSSARR